MTRPTCAVCGRRGLDTWVEDNRGTRACPAHRRTYCSYCGGFAMEGRCGGVDLGDGRRLCRECASDAVLTPADAGPSLVRVETTLADRFGLRLPYPVRARMVTLEALHATGVGNAGICGVTRSAWRRSGATTERSVVDVLLLHGLPRANFERIVAHELGHAWMATKQFPVDLESWLEEGIAESIAYLYLETLSGTRAGELKDEMWSRPDHYGQGFRRVRAAMDRDGVVSTLRVVKATGALP